MHLDHAAPKLEIILVRADALASGRTLREHWLCYPSHRRACLYGRVDDGGAQFKSPVRVNNHPDSAVIIGTVRGPHLAIEWTKSSWWDEASVSQKIQAIFEEN